MSTPTYLALLTSRPRRDIEVACALRALIDPCAAEPANRGFEVHRVAADPGRFVMFERYACAEGFSEHWRQPHMMGFLERAEDLLARPPEILALLALEQLRPR